MPRIITVGVPAHNEEKTIADTLAHLRRQKLPKGAELEIIVGANACTDRTHEIVESIARKDPRVKLLRIAERGKPNAMNFIKANSRGDVIVFCDADTRVEEEAVKKLVEVLYANNEIHAVSVIPSPLRMKGRNWAEAMSSALRGHHSNKQRQRLAAGENINMIGSLLAIKKEHLPTIPTRILSEDDWLSHKLAGKYAILSSVSARMRGPTTLSGLIGQSRRHTMGRLQLRKEFSLDPSTRRKRIFRGIYLKGLPLSERLLLIPGTLLRIYGTWKGKRAFKRGEFIGGGWTPPKRR